MFKEKNYTYQEKGRALKSTKAINNPFNFKELTIDE